MRSRRSWWTIFAACSAVVLLALVWTTVVVVRLEQAEIEARTEAEHHEALRLALWRMDSWLAPLLAREAARPYFDYEPFYASTHPSTTLIEPLGQDEALTASPLLDFESDYFQLHYQLGSDGVITSPQAPAGGMRALAQDVYNVDGSRIEMNAAKLGEISNYVTPEQVSECVIAYEAGDAVMTTSSFEPRPPLLAQGAISKAAQRTQEEGRARKGYAQQFLQNDARLAQMDNAGQSAPVDVGSLLSFWTSEGGPDGQGELIFTRRIRVGLDTYYQGFLCNWPKLRDALLEQIRDLYADGRLVPVYGGPVGDPTAGRMLATIPVALDVPRPPLAVAGVLTPVRGTLMLAWVAMLAGLVAVAVTLRASIAFGEKRSRFASAVTHELRTPLTTFQMYSEMLADGMVTDDEQRQIYLETLRHESGRLTNLVENVMAYARLEEGRARPTPTNTTLGAVLDDVRPALQRRAGEANMNLSVEVDAPQDTPLCVPVDAVGQVLLNLVDNACKYATAGEDRTIHLAAGVRNGVVAISVRDHGPGIPRRFAEAVFSPFDRGGRDPSDAVPGVGLGLALARGLAQNFGGDLELDPVSGGASLTVTIPTRDQPAPG